MGPECYISSSDSDSSSEDSSTDIAGTSKSGESSKHRVYTETFTYSKTNKKKNDPSLYYDMSGEKLLYIFQSTTHPRALMEGSEKEVVRLQKTFSRIGFTVAEPYRAYTYGAIMNKLQYIRHLDHKETSCIAIVIMTHGHKGGILEAADRTYNLDEVVNPFLKTSELAGKPKLFFIDACRGDKEDPGLQVYNHCDGKPVDIPAQSDCLIMLSSFEEYVSYGTSRSSWMTKALCNVINEHHKRLHILELMTLVNNRVMMNFTTSTDPRERNKKQIPEVQFTLTKFLKFSRKPLWYRLSKLMKKKTKEGGREREENMNEKRRHLCHRHHYY